MNSNSVPPLGAVCLLKELDLTGAYGVNPAGPQKIKMPFFIVQTRAEPRTVMAYQNRCPHLGVPLEWQPNQFLNHMRDYIICGTHGALFRLEDGFCIRGPCARKALIPVPIKICGGWVCLVE